jgi:cellulose biosynthesis protein BcsQ
VSLFYERSRTNALCRGQGAASERPAPPRRSREGRSILMRRFHPRPWRMVTVTSNKGGVGKTTLALNLAVYLRALREELPILAFSVDDQSTLDRVFSFHGDAPEETVATALRAGNFASAIRTGQFGIRWVPSAPDIAALKREIDDPLQLQAALDRTGWRGLVVVDTKADLEILTRNAIAASELTLVPVTDDASLREAVKVFELLDEWALPRERARIVLSMVDLRVKFRQGEARDVLSLLLAEIRRRGLPLLETFVSASPKVATLTTNPEGRAISILHGAPGSLVHRQMVLVAREVLGVLERPDASPQENHAGEDGAPDLIVKRCLLRRA